MTSLRDFRIQIAILGDQLIRVSDRTLKKNVGTGLITGVQTYERAS